MGFLFLRSYEDLTTKSPWEIRFPGPARNAFPAPTPATRHIPHILTHAGLASLTSATAPVSSLFSRSSAAARQPLASRVPAACQLRASC